jgi:hypothetical protein
MRRRLLAIGAGLALLVAACSSPHHPAASPGAAQISAPNPDVIPPVITPAYVNAVFAVLEHVAGNASRALLATNSVSPTVVADLRAIYNDPLYAQEIKIAHQSLAGDLSNVRRPPGDVRILVAQLISSSTTCIFVRTTSDYSKVLIHPVAPAPSEYWTLKPRQAGADPKHLNGTAWALSFNVDFQTVTSIPDQCATS